MDTRYNQNMRVTGKKVKRKAAATKRPRKERQIQIPNIWVSIDTVLQVETSTYL